jgi:osmotically-inducible protein OsmY
MKTTIFSKTLLATFLAASLSTTAMASSDMSSSNNEKWQNTAMDAWIDGKAEATLLFNGNLDSFDINTDVEQGTVLLTGKVNSEIDRELAEELILGIDGVESVHNELVVMQANNGDESVTSTFTDAKISTVVKSRLLFNSEISGTDIDVNVENQVVTLDGDVSSDAAKQLAMNIAKNTEDVKDVKNMLIVETESE